MYSGNTGTAKNIFTIRAILNLNYSKRKKKKKMKCITLRVCFPIFLIIAIAWALISASDKGSSEFFDTNIDLAKKLIQKYEGSPHGDAEPFQTADAYRKLGIYHIY